MDAYLIVSDVVASVTISGARVEENSPPRSPPPRVVGAHHDPVRVEAVEYRRALAQELGIGDDADVGAADHLLHHVAEPTGTVDLLTTMAPGSSDDAISLAAAST